MGTRYIISALLAFMSVLGASATQTIALQIDLRLEHAVFQGTKPDNPTSLEINLTRTNDVWDPTAVVAENYNKTTSIGRVSTGEITDDRVTLALSVAIDRDAYVPAGRGEYRVILARDKDGRLTGRFTGTFKGIDVAGDATGSIAPVQRATDFAPVAPDEHPRLLFRKTDIPALKAKLATQFGKAAIAGMTDAIGLGVRYQLTGDATLAEEARKLVDAQMAVDDDGQGQGRRLWAPRIEQVAVTYDLCYDAWPKEYRTVVETYLLRIADQIYGFRRQWASGEFSWDVLKHGGRAWVGPAYAALALWGVKGPAPTAPSASYAGRPSAPNLPPTKGYVLGADVPVSTYANDQMPTEWLCAGGLKPTSIMDPLAARGGEQYRPTSGDTVTDGTKIVTFARISHEVDKGYLANGTTTVLDITNAIGRVYFSTNYFYTVIDNDRERLVQIRTDNAAAVIYLAGVRRQAGDFAVLQPGRYPMLIAISIEDTKPWGRITMRLRLAEVTPAERDAILATDNAVHQLSMADWAWDTAYWKASSEMRPEFARLFARTKLSMTRYCRRSLADGGLPSSLSYEGTTDAMVGRYASYYRSVFGTPVSANDDITPSILAYLLQGKTGTYRGDPRGMAGPGPELRPSLFALVPIDKRAAVMTAWDKQLGITDAITAKKVLAVQPVMSFLQYPVIAKYLISPVACERIEAAQMLPLLKLDDLKPLQPLLISLMQDEYWDVRENASTALVRLGGEAVPALVASLGLPGFYARLYGARTLGVIGPVAKDAAPALGEQLASNSVDLRRVAATAIAGTGNVVPAIKPLVIALADDDDNVRNAAAYALQMAGKVVIPDLIALLVSERRDVTYVVSRILRALGPDASEATPALFKALLRDIETTRVEVNALGDGYIKDRTTRNAILDCEPLRALAAIGIPAVPSLVNLLRTGDSLQQRYAMDALGRVGAAGAPALPDILTALKAETDPGRKVNLMSIIAGLGDGAAGAVPVLVEQLAATGANDIAGRYAVDALAKIGQTAVQPLIVAFSNADPIIRRRAAETLGKMAYGTAVSARAALSEATKDADTGVRDAAIAALKTLPPV